MNIIEFYFDGVTYYAEEGMTFRDWAESEYGRNVAEVSEIDSIFINGHSVSKIENACSETENAKFVIEDKKTYYRGNDLGWN